MTNSQIDLGLPVEQSCSSKTSVTPLMEYVSLRVQSKAESQACHFVLLCKRWSNYRTARVMCAFLSVVCKLRRPGKLGVFQFTQWGGYKLAFNARFHLVEFNQEVQRPTCYVHNGRELHKHITQHAGIGQVALHLHSVPRKARNSIGFSG